MNPSNERSLSVLQTPDEVRRTLSDACRKFGYTLSKKRGEDQHYKLSAYHPVYGYYYFNLDIEIIDATASRILLSLRGGRSIFYDPMKLADQFIDHLEADLNKYSY